VVAVICRVLVVLAAWRLMLPQGVCLCRLVQPVASLAAGALGLDPPAPEPPEDDSHLAGCPGSRVGPFRAETPVAPPALSSLVLTCPSPVAPPALSPISSPLLPELPYQTGPPRLFVTFCAFLL
jgi:hypothetical protein